MSGDLYVIAWIIGSAGIWIAFCWFCGPAKWDGPSSLGIDPRLLGDADGSLSFESGDLGCGCDYVLL
jgi:hypothetical protein